MPQTREQKQRAATVVHLRLGEGLDWDEIATKLEFKDSSGPRKLFERTMRRAKPPDLEAQRATSLAVIDEMRTTMVAMANDEGNSVQDRVRAATVVIRNEERRARLLGLDAPDRHRIDVIDYGLIAQVLEDRRRELAHAQDDRRQLAENLPAVITGGLGKVPALPRASSST